MSYLITILAAATATSLTLRSTDRSEDRYNALIQEVRAALLELKLAAEKYVKLRSRERTKIDLA
jgi:hypothetical protein